MISTPSDTVELRSAVAVDDEVAKTVRWLVDDFESCVTYLSESSDSDLSFPEVGDKPTSGWPVRQPQNGEVKRPADPHVIKMIILELSAFLHLPAESVAEESSLFSLGLDSLKSVTLSHRLRERGISISPMDIIQAGSVRGIASASVAERQQESLSEEESVSELDQLLRQDLPVESVRLDRGDQIDITAATALQAGMLSQVMSKKIREVYRVLTSPFS